MNTYLLLFQTLDDTFEKTPEQSKDKETDPTLPDKVQTRKQKGMGTYI